MTAGERVLITGATGFVGSHLVSALARSHLQVRALVRSTSDVGHLDALGIERAEADLRDAPALKRAVRDADIVFHLAGLTRARNEAEFRSVNVDGTRRLVDAMLDSGRPRRLVFVSSLAAVGPARNGRPVHPDDEPRPLTAYGRSKLEAERVCLAARDTVGVVVLRPPAVYGPGDRDLLSFFRLARFGFLPVPSGPPRRLQMIHAADLADAIRRAGVAEAAAGVYHTAEPRAYAWPDVLDMVAEAVGRRARHVPVPSGLIRMAAVVSELVGRVRGRPSIFTRDKAQELLAPGWLCDTERARRELGFVARTPLAEGLRETAAWYRAYGWLD
ncbi:MAG TPA: NAD-dependent epimerase/dehydratase family protein [Longimicrobiales bacterium]|nr:NAD-dependent epimerase/dehydratase family protein [Longimicrobiales bacterium]